MKELGQRTDAELEELFGAMYAGWDRGVNVLQERRTDGETRFTETHMTPLELTARFVAAEIGVNIYEISGRAALAPIIVYSQIQARIGPLFEEMTIEIERLKEDCARTERNRDMWKGQCARQAEQLSKLHDAPAAILGLKAAVRAAELALFVIRKQGIMPNASWQTGFEKDLATAKAALAAQKDFTQLLQE